jgi:hypothetical protein
VASVLLIYVAGAFMLTQMMGIKRVLEGILIAPVGVAAAYYAAREPRQLTDPLVLFVGVKTVCEIAWRAEFVWILDNVATLFALVVIQSAPRRSIETGVKILVAIATTFAVMALIQLLALFLYPDLDKFALIVSDQGVLLNDVRHPIAVLGLVSDEKYSVLGHEVARMRSFAMEPSLNLVYFMLPAMLAYFVESRLCWWLGSAVVVYCVLSLSGSIFMAIGFAGLWWCLLHVVSVRVALLYGLPATMTAYLMVIKTQGVLPFFAGMTFLSQYGDEFRKGESLKVRTMGASQSLDIALVSPFGNAGHADVPGPLFVNSAIEAGWLGVVFLIVYLARTARQLNLLSRRHPTQSAVGIGTLLLLGTMSAVIVFNDYQMSNYAGVVMLALLYRMLLLRNAESNAQ